MSEKPKAPGAVYFDSNILRKAGWPDPSARLLEVLSKATEIGVTPSLVDLVRRELVEGWIRDLIRDRRSLVDKGKEFSRRALELSEVSEPGRLPLPTQMREHIEKVTEKFTQRFRPVPTTSQPTSHFMDLALSRGGAFLEGGKGFNDTVILVSIIEDMTNHCLDTAILVSEDRGYQSEGMRRVTGDKQLCVVTSIDGVDEILDRLVSDQIHAYLDEQKRTLLAAVEAQRYELQKFLHSNLLLTREDLGTIDTVRKTEFLEIVAFEDAHSVGFVLGKENRDENRLSVDVKIRVRLETETFLFERRRERLDASPFAIHPEDILVTTSEKEIVVTVEGAAEVTEAGIQAIRFISVYAKKERAFFSRLLGGSA